MAATTRSASTPTAAATRMTAEGLQEDAFASSYFYSAPSPARRSRILNIYTFG